MTSDAQAIQFSNPQENGFSKQLYKGQMSSSRPLKHAVSQIYKEEKLGSGLWPNIAHIHRIDEITHMSS